MADIYIFSIHKHNKIGALFSLYYICLDKSIPKIFFCILIDYDSYVLWQIFQNSRKR